jgi:hypothetical protein
MTEGTQDADAAARAAAVRLQDRYGPVLPVDVERVIRTRQHAPDQFLDPISLGALLVSAATLAWTVYQDLRSIHAEPSPSVVARTVRVQLQVPPGTDPADRDRIIEVTVEEVINSAASEDIQG